MKLFVSALLLITVIEMETTSGREQNMNNACSSRCTMVAEVGSLLQPSVAERTNGSLFVKPIFTGELTSLATRTKTFQHLQSVENRSLTPSHFDTQSCVNVWEKKQSATTSQDSRWRSEGGT